MTVEPPADSLPIRAYKGPFIACELLTCDVPQITVRLLESGEPLDRLFSFLSTRPVNQTLAGYFEKVVSVLICKGPEVVLNCFFGPQAAAKQLIEQVNSPSLSQVLIRGILCEVGSYLDERKAVIRNLAVKELAEGNAAAVSATLCELITTGHSSPQWTGLASVLYSPEVVTALFEFLSGGEATAKAAARVLTALISNHFFRVAISQSQKIAEDVTVTEEETQSDLMLAVLKGCARVQECFEKAQGAEIKAGFGDGKVDILGELRLVCAELILSLVRVDIESITVTIGQLGLFTTLTSLFFRYHWNSFLHSCFYQLCTILLNSPVLAVRSLLTLDTSLIESIAAFETEEIYSSGWKLRKGQRGFVTRIAAMLLKTAETHEDVEEVISRVPAWQNFVETQLNPMLEIENRPGPDSRVNTHQTEEDEEFDLHLDVEQKEGNMFPYMFPGEQQRSEPQMTDDFGDSIPMGEDLNVGDLEAEELFDLTEKEPPFRACLRGTEAQEMKVQGAELEAAKVKSLDCDAEQGREFNSRDYWRLPTVENSSSLPDLD